MSLPIAIRHNLKPRFIDTVTINSAEITNATTVETSVAVARARTDMHFLTPNNDLEDGIVWAAPPVCKVNGTIIFKLGNISAAPIDPASFDAVIIAV